MAQNTTNRRILATSSDQPNTSMDPTHKRHHHHPSSKPTTTTATTASSIYRTTNPGEPTKNFSSSSTNQRVIRTTTTHFDTHLQAKAMSLSAMADSSKPNRDHPHHHHYIKTVPNLQNQKKPTQEKSSSRRALKGPNSQQREVVITEEGHEEIKRLSSGAIVKIKELKVSDEDHHHHDNDDDADEKKASSIVSSIGKRRSFIGSKIELSDFLNSSGARVVSVDMPPFMQIHAVGCARKACDSLEKFTSKALALSLKKEFDGVYGPAWHCIVGSSFGSFVTHSVEQIDLPHYFGCKNSRRREQVLRDLKLGNLLVNANCELKICDFGNLLEFQLWRN